MARVLLTKALLDEKLAVRPHQQSMLWDSKVRGLSVLISRGPEHERRATLTFRVVYYLRSAPGKPRYLRLGRYDPERSDLAAVRRAAQQARITAEEGGDPKRPRPTGKFAETVNKYIAEHAEQNRTVAECKRIFEVYVKPEWADKNIEDIEKSEVSDLLSKIARGKIEHKGTTCGTPSVARAVRAQLVALFNWWDAKHGSKTFRSPVPRIMKSDKVLSTPDARERALDEFEIRALWHACAEMGAYGAAVRCALLTAQRFVKVVSMRRTDLKQHLRVQGQDAGNLWDPTRPDDPKNKRVSVVPLARLTREGLAGMPQIDGGDFVFTFNGRAPLSGFTGLKRRLDKRMLELLRQEAEAAGEDPDQVGESVAGKQRVKPWQHRDLRRTSRTMMAHIGISNEVAEHCLGHVMTRIVRTYNRYGYLPEKRAAFEKLADHIERIVQPPAGNVTVLATRRQGRRRRIGRG